MFDSELESFKTRIDLRQYAAAHGYQRDPRESWTGTDVMRHSVTDDKILVKFGTKRAPDHWGYFSFRRDDDHGSIIDFVQRRLNLSLGAVRKELRPWIGEPPVPVPPFPPPIRTNKDRTTVETEYAKMQAALSHPYLVNERALPAALLESERFAGRVRIDARGNAIFPHFDAHGLCGYEIKNTGFTGFAAGGSKGLWLSHERPDDNRLVFCESAIDGLSYATLFVDPQARYASIGGRLNPVQPELIRAASARMPENSRIVAAMDADEAGGKLAEVVREAVQLTGRDDLSYVFQEPFGFKDWNDQIRGKQRDFFPVARVSGLDVR
ncbi:MAG: DUF3991 domain-containing protein [Bryobacteraceae bacterium]